MVRLIALVAALSGCGGDDSPEPGPGPSGPQSTSLRVTAISPASHVSDVEPDTEVTATFSAAIEPSTLSVSTFVLMDDNNQAVMGSISYDAAARKATYKPALPLALSKTYTAHVTDQVGASGGGAAEERQWSFSVVGPDVGSTVMMGPANSSTGISVKAFAYALFPITLNETSITASSLSMSDATGAQVAGTAAARGDHAVAFYPSAELSPNTEYTVKLAKGIKTDDGGAVNQDVTWKFVTASARSATVQLGGALDDALFGAATDAQGNVYVTGFTDSIADPATGEISTALVLSKIAADGRVQWQKTFSDGQSHTVGSDVAVNSKGEVVVVGTVSGATGQDPASGQDILVARFKADTGEQLTPQIYGSPGTDSGMAVVVDASDNIYVAATVDAAMPTKTALGGEDAVVMRLASDGSLTWVTQFGTAETDLIHGIALDAQSNVYVAGRTNGSIGTLTNQGLADMLVAKLDANGKVMQTQLVGSAGDDIGNDIAVSGTTVVIGGWTGGVIEPNVTLGGEADAVVLTLDAGNLSRGWAKQTGGSDFDGVTAVAVDSTGSIYAVEVTGRFGPPMPDMQMGTVLRKRAVTNGAEVGTAGTLVPTRTSTPGTGDEHVAGFGVAVSAEGNIFVAGTLHMGAELDGNVTFPFDNDGFVASFTTSGVKR